MKITAIFLNGKKHKLNIEEKINFIFFNISKYIYFCIFIFLVMIFAKHNILLSKVIYFGSNFRQAEKEKIKLADIFDSYGIYNKKNYALNHKEVIQEADNQNVNEDELEKLDNYTKDKKEQSVFSSNNINVEVTENSSNIQRITLNKMKILNYSSKRDIDFKSLANSDITLTKKSDQILLYNTHTSESYANSEKYKFEYSGARRSQDSKYNMLSVAKTLKNNLDSKGFSTIHDTTAHDYGTYTSSYARSRITVKNALSTMQRPGIIIDVHRDATADLDYRPTVNINGVQVAQCMLVMGVGNDVSKNQYYEDNLKLALKIQQIADEVYPGLFKPMIIRSSVYNQDLNKYSLLVEVGASGNTLDEAYLATRCIANLLNIVYKD